MIKPNIPSTPRSAGLEAHIKSLEERVKNIEKDNKMLEKELNEKMDDIDTANTAYDALMREYSELQITNSMYQTRLDEAEELITEQVEKIEEYDHR